MSEKIERLEDLTPELQDALINLVTKEDVATQLIREHYDTLESLGLAKWYWNVDAGFCHPTTRGAELVADYQRRHDSAASLKDDKIPAFWQAIGFKTEDEYLFSQSLAKRDLEVVALQAEIARLREENATLTARNQEQGRDLAAALKRIEQLKDIVASK